MVAPPRAAAAATAATRRLGDAPLSRDQLDREAEDQEPDPVGARHHAKAQPPQVVERGLEDSTHH
eukprot:5906704-Alexandrium_andersonii.AAC.1